MKKPFPVMNELVLNFWRRMVVGNLYTKWYQGEGAFVRDSPEIMEFVDSYFREPHPTPAMNDLFAATERLLRTSLLIHGASATGTLPNLLQSAVSPDNKLLNLYGMCCDHRSIAVIKQIRNGVAHGNYKEDVRELTLSGWTPEDVKKSYQEIRAARLYSPHHVLVLLFDRVDPETGMFIPEWEDRRPSLCSGLGTSHDASGKLLEERPQ